MPDDISYLLLVSILSQLLKNPPGNAGDAGDPGSIPGSGRSSGEGNGYLLHCSYWRIPWTKEPGGLQSMGSPSRTQLSDRHCHCDSALTLPSD